MPKHEDTLMDQARRAKCAVDAGITDELSAFMSVFHPEVNLFTPTMIMARQESRRKQYGG